MSFFKLQRKIISVGEQNKLKLKYPNYKETAVKEFFRDGYIHTEELPSGLFVTQCVPSWAGGGYNIANLCLCDSGVLAYLNKEIYNPQLKEIGSKIKMTTIVVPYLGVVNTVDDTKWLFDFKMMRDFGKV